MPRLALSASVVVMAVALSGCGVTSLSRGAVSLLPDYEIRHAPKVSCAQFLDRIDPKRTMDTAAQRSAVEVCEEMNAGVIVHPDKVQDALRQSIPGVPSF